MDNVHCIGVGELTEEQICFLVGCWIGDKWYAPWGVVSIATATGSPRGYKQ